MDAARKLGPFEILDLLGKGGMGEVYRARDPRLGREVALKVLPAELQQDPDRRSRFLREARAAAKLNHPNITTIHEVGEADGRDYIAMELVEGPTLVEVVRERELTSDEIVELAIPIADALGVAHEAGVIHRDLKLANVMLDGRGRPKLLDFGLAKLHEEQAAAVDVPTDLTQPGQVFGTPNAMSPEQAAGKPVDRRSDVFSFGTLLYELGSRRSPFQRDTVIETVTAVIHEDPPSLRGARRDLSSGLVRIVERALRKDPAERYQTMGELGAELEALRAGGARPPLAGVAVAALALVAALVLMRMLPKDTPPSTAEDLRSIAVLPFETLSATPSPEDELLAAGIQNDVQAQLGKIRDLRVIARESVDTAVAEGGGPARIAERLGVASLLEGAVQRAGDQVRITLALIEPRSGDQLWTESFDRAFSVEQLFAIQSEIALEVATSLDAELTSEEASAIAALPTDNIEAYEAYLRAGAVVNIFDRGAEGLRDMQLLLRRAVDLDPQFAEARAHLGAMILLETWMFTFDAERRALAEEEILKASRLDPTAPEVLSARGLAAYQRRNYEQAREYLELALQKHPNNTPALTTLAALLRRSGDIDASIETYRRAVTANPLDTPSYAELGTTLMIAGRFDEADAMIAKALELTEAFSTALVDRTQVKLMRAIPLEEAREAVEALYDELLEQGTGVEERAEVWEMLASVGSWERAEDWIDRLPAGFERRMYQTGLLVVPSLRARMAFLQGGDEEARAHFERALEVIASEEDPEDPRVLMAKAGALAGLGRGAEAIRAGETALERMPRERDLIAWYDLAVEFAVALELIGETERAAGVMIELAEAPSPWNFARLDRDQRLPGSRQEELWRTAVDGSVD